MEKQFWQQYFLSCLYCNKRWIIRNTIKKVYIHNKTDAKARIRIKNVKNPIYTLKLGF